MMTIVTTIEATSVANFDDKTCVVALQLFARQRFKCATECHVGATPKGA